MVLFEVKYVVQNCCAVQTFLFISVALLTLLSFSPILAMSAAVIATLPYDDLPYLANSEKHSLSEAFQNNLIEC